MNLLEDVCGRGRNSDACQLLPDHAGDHAYNPFCVEVARERLTRIERWAETQPGYEKPPCFCEYADVGVGPWMKVAEVPDCPQCTEFGYAAWAVDHGNDLERQAAHRYLGTVL